MSDQQWMDRIVGDRMAVDQEFQERVLDSPFSSQQWGLVMTVAEFEIEDPEDPERAELVADTEKIPRIMPELDRIESRGQGGAPPGGRSSGGLFGSIRDALGLGSDGGVDGDRLDAAERLVEEYARTLQRHLKDRDKWEPVCEVAATNGD